MKQKTISVIVPVYNGEQYLSQCIESILGQTYPAIEVILINDGSKDSSLKICREYEKKDNRLKVYDIPNGGVSRARNFGLSVATGDYIAFVDCDDFLAPDMYRKLLEKAESEHADMTFCKYICLEQERERIYPEIALNKFVDNKDFSYFFCCEKEVNNYIMGSCWRVLTKSSLLGETRFHTDLRFVEDLIFIMELTVKATKLALVDEYLYHYRYFQSFQKKYYGKDWFEGNRKLYYLQKDLMLKNGQSKLDILRIKTFLNITFSELKNNKDYRKQLKIYEQDPLFDELKQNESYREYLKICRFYRKVMVFFVYHGWYRVYKLIEKILFRLKLNEFLVGKK